jgi:hypothetical protein
MPVRSRSRASAGPLRGRPRSGGGRRNVPPEDPSSSCNANDPGASSSNVVWEAATESRSLEAARERTASAPMPNRSQERTRKTKTRLLDRLDREGGSQDAKQETYKRDRPGILRLSVSVEVLWKCRPLPGWISPSSFPSTAIRAKSGADPSGSIPSSYRLAKSWVLTVIVPPPNSSARVHEVAVAQPDGVTNAEAGSGAASRSEPRAANARLLARVLIWRSSRITLNHSRAKESVKNP